MRLTRPFLLVVFIWLAGPGLAKGGGCDFDTDAPPALSLRDVVTTDGPSPIAFDRARTLAADATGGAPAGAPILIYVHGFTTDRDGAICAAAGVIADWPGRDVPVPVIVDWPSQQPPRFSRGQEIADAAGPVLAAMLGQLVEAGREVHVVAHSLGAQLTLEALLALHGEGLPPGTLATVVLVQGAASVKGIYRWEGMGETSFPSCRIDLQGADGCAPLDYAVDGGEGRYHAATRIARRLVFTTARRDSALGFWFYLDETYVPRRASPAPARYRIPGESLSQAPSHGAIGLPFRRTEFSYWDEESPLVFDDPHEGRWNRFEAYEIPVAPWAFDPNVIARHTIRQSFVSDHPGLMEIPLESIVPQGHKVADWHAPLSDEVLRPALLRGAFGPGPPD